MTAWHHRQRDANGWLIPRDGTISRQVYDLLVQGMSEEEIARELPQLRVVGPLVWRIKNADRANAGEKRRYAERTGRPPVRLPAEPEAGLTQRAVAHMEGRIAALLEAGLTDQAAEVKADMDELQKLGRKFGRLLDLRQPPPP